MRDMAPSGPAAPARSRRRLALLGGTMLQAAALAFPAPHAAASPHPGGIAHPRTFLAAGPAALLRAAGPLPATHGPAAVRMASLRDTGLAALVAPRARDAARVTARVTSTAQGGTLTHALDLYGDGLLSLNVTRQVRQGSGGQTLLVTRDGAAKIAGGTVALTAGAVDSVVTGLVSAGGAPHAATRMLVVQGTGGGIVMDAPAVLPAAAGTSAAVARDQPRPLPAAEQKRPQIAALQQRPARQTLPGYNLNIDNGPASVNGVAIKPSFDTATRTVTVTTGYTETNYHGVVILAATGTLTLNGKLTLNTNGSTVKSIELDGVLGLVLNGTLSAAGIPVLLESAHGAITEHAGASIVAGTLTAIAGLGGVSLSQGSNTIGTLAAFSNISTQQKPITYEGLVATPVAFGSGTPVRGTVPYPATSQSIFGSYAFPQSPNGYSILAGAGSASLADTAPALTILAPVKADAATPSSAGNVTLSLAQPSAGAGLAVHSAVTGGDVLISVTGAAATSTSFTQSAGTAITAAGGQGAAGHLRITVDAGTLAIGGTLAAPALAGTKIAGGSVVLTESGAGAITEAASGVIQADLLQGSAGGTPGSTVPGSITLGLAPGSTRGTLTGGNAIGTLAGLSANGNILVQDSDSLVLGGITAAGSIVVAGKSAIAIAGGATVASTSSGVTLAAVTLTQSAGATLSGGEAAASGDAIDLLTSGAGITLGGTLVAGRQTGNTLYAGIANLVATGGTITDTGCLRAGTLTGAATAAAGGGNAAFASATNSLAVLGSFTATGNITVNDTRALTLAGPVSAGGNIVIADTPGATDGVLIVAGSIAGSGKTSSVSLSNSLGIAEIAGGNVTAPFVTLLSHGAIAQQAGAIAATTTLSLTADAATDFAQRTGLASLGNVAGIALGGVLSAGTLDLVARAGNITETLLGAASPTGRITANTLTATAGTATGAALYAIDLNTGFPGTAGTGVNAIGVFGPLFASRAITLADDAAGRFHPGGATQYQAGDNVFLRGSITAQGGQIAIAITHGNLDIVPGTASISARGAANFTVPDGGIAVFGGTIGGSSIGIVAGGAFTQTGGSLNAGGNGSTPAIGISAAGSSTVIDRGTTATVAGIAIGGTLVAGPGIGSTAGNRYAGMLSLAATAGNIVETAFGAAGVIDAGLLKASASGSTPASIVLATASGTATGNNIEYLGNLSATGSLALADGIALSVIGTVAATTAMALAAPAISVAGGTLQLRSTGVMSLVADNFAFETPQDVKSAGGIVALDLLGQAGTTFSVGPGNATVSANSLEHIDTGGGTLALGTRDGHAAATPSPAGTSWSVGTAGTVSLLTFLAPLDLSAGAAPPAKALGVFSNDTIAGSAGITVTTLYGAAGGASSASGAATLTGSNAIGTLAGFSTSRTATAPAGSATVLDIADRIALTVTGPVSAQDGAVLLDVTGTLAGTPNSLTLAGNITGTDVRLRASGAITQDAVTVVAAGAAGATSGTLVLDSVGGRIGLAGTTQAGTLASGAYTGDILLNAGGGISETGALRALTLAAAATQNIALAAATNTVSVIGNLKDATTGLDLYGLTAAGATGIAFTDAASSLLIAGDTVDAAGRHATVSALGPHGQQSPGTGTITLAVTGAGGALTLGPGAGGAGTGATIAARGAVGLTAAGSVVQNRGTVISENSDVAIAALSGSVTQNGGAIAASTGNVAIAAVTAIAQTGGGLISAFRNVTLRASENGAGIATISQTDSAITAGADVTLIARSTRAGAGTAAITQTASRIAAGNDAILQAPENAVDQGAGSAIAGAHGVTIASLGTITADGAIRAAGIATDATSGTVVLDSTGGGIAIGGIVSGAGTLGSGIFTPATSSALLLAAGGGGIAETGTGAVRAGTLAAASTGSIALAGAANQVANIAALADSALGLTLDGLAADGAGGIALADALALTIGPDASATRPTVRATAAGAGLTITETAADLTLRDASLRAAGNITLASAGNLTDTGSRLTTTGGSIGLTATDAIASDGATLQAFGAVAIQAGGALAQTAASVRAATIRESGATLTVTDSGIVAGGAIDLTSSGTLSLANSQLTSGGTIFLTAASDIALAGTTVDAAGTLPATPGAVIVQAGGAFAQTGGVIAATGQAAIEAGADVMQSAGSTLAAGTLAVSAGGDIILAGIAGARTALTLAAQRSITEAAAGAPGLGSIFAGSFAAAAGGSIALAGANQIATIAPIGTLAGLIAQGGDILLQDSQALTVQPGAAIFGVTTVTLQGPALTLNNASLLGQHVRLTETGALTQTGGSLAAFVDATLQGQTIRLSGLVQTAVPQANTGTLTLLAGSGGIAAASGTLIAGTLAAASQAGIDLASTANLLGTIGATGAATGLSASGAIQLDDGQSLTIAAPVRGAAITVAVTGDLRESAGVTLAAAGALSLSATGTASLAGSVSGTPVGISARTIAVQGDLAAGSTLGLRAGADITEAAGAVISAAGSATLAAPGTIGIAGTLRAPDLSIGGSNTALVAWTGAVVETGTFRQNRNGVVTILKPVSGGPGAFITAANFTNTGTSTVAPRDGGQALLQVTITGNGAASLGTLLAPATQLVLSLEHAGTASGFIDVAGLNVFYAPGTTPTRPVQLAGMVDGQGGFGAAASGFTHTQPNANYQINGCPIQSTNCVLLSPLIVPVTNPVNDFAEDTQRKRQRDDAALPNVAEEDY